MPRRGSWPATISAEVFPGYRAKHEGDGFLPDVFGHSWLEILELHILQEPFGWGCACSWRVGLNLTLLEQGQGWPSCPQGPGMSMLWLLHRAPHC